MTFSSLNTDPNKTRDWQRRSAERYAEKQRKEGRKPLERRSELAPMSQRKLDELAARGQTHPSSSLKRSAPRYREPTEQEKATAWHAQVCAGRLCVVCGEPAGPWGHHALRKEWVARIGLRAHIWDVELGIPPCDPCHMNHEAGAVRIERAHLIPTGHWETLVRWATLLDARYVELRTFPAGSSPLLSRLERDYPARAAA